MTAGAQHRQYKQRAQRSGDKTCDQYRQQVRDAAGSASIAAV